MTPEAFLSAPRAAVRWWDHLVPGRARRIQGEIDAREGELLAAFVEAQFPSGSITATSVDISALRIAPIDLSALRVEAGSGRLILSSQG